MGRSVASVCPSLDLLHIWHDETLVEYEKTLSLGHNWYFGGKKGCSDGNAKSVLFLVYLYSFWSVFHCITDFLIDTRGVRHGCLQLSIAN